VVNDLLRELAAAERKGGGRCRLPGAFSPRLTSPSCEAHGGGRYHQTGGARGVRRIFQNGRRAAFNRRSEGLRAQNDTDELEKLARAALAADPVAVAKVKGGNDKAINALKGPIMKATRGKADPKAIDELLRRLIAGCSHLPSSLRAISSHACA
jgi:aspartyl-tRNA(Asn)/glutamyl-tRNA(Gln) amidotransferase subunit B